MATLLTSAAASPAQEHGVPVTAPMQPGAAWRGTRRSAVGVLVEEGKWCSVWGVGQCVCVVCVGCVGWGWGCGLCNQQGVITKQQLITLSRAPVHRLHPYRVIPEPPMAAGRLASQP